MTALASVESVKTAPRSPRRTLSPGRRRWERQLRLRLNSNRLTCQRGDHAQPLAAAMSVASVRFVVAPLWACAMRIWPGSASVARSRAPPGLQTDAASAAGRRSTPLTAGCLAPAIVCVRAAPPLWRRSCDGSKTTPLCVALHVTVCFRGHCTLVWTAEPAALAAASA